MGPYFYGDVFFNCVVEYWISLLKLILREIDIQYWRMLDVASNFLWVLLSRNVLQMWFN